MKPTAIPQRRGSFPSFKFIFIISKATTGTMARTYSYTAYGMPTGRTAGTVQNFTYNFDVQKGNLLSRKDNARNITESFGYDNLNRLSTIGAQAIAYAPNGNITQMPGVGTLAYGNTAKPYQVTLLTPTGTAVPLREQSVTYTSYQRPNSITENGITASFAYNAGGDRVKMNVMQGTTALLTRYYIGKQYELDVQTNTERLYLGGDVYSAPAVYTKEAGVWKIYYICRDYLGSITHVANADGSLKAEYSYDAWGRLRNPATQVAYASGSEPTLFLGRGYTGHEHLAWFGLINMNARLYDPVLGRFLSPDPYVQAPNFTQNFNRYSYCLNNPLVYYDKDGEIIGTIFTAIINTFENIFKHGVNFGRYDYSKTQRAWEIDKGLFTGNFWQVLNKWTWGLPNTIIGNATGHTMNVWGKVDNVTHLNGAVALSGVTPGNSAFTIGNYIFGPDNFKADWRDHLFVHEYGHYIQSQQFGPLFLPIIGSTSLASAAGLGGNDHSTRWFEVNASKQGAKYFDKRYGAGAKGYVANSPDYFDINSFVSGGNSPYINPRKGTQYQGSGHPISGARFSIWDVFVPIGTIAAIYGGYSLFIFIF